MTHTHSRFTVCQCTFTVVPRSTPNPVNDSCTCQNAVPAQHVVWVTCRKDKRIRSSNRNPTSQLAEAKHTNQVLPDYASGSRSLAYSQPGQGSTMLCVHLTRCSALDTATHWSQTTDLTQQQQQRQRDTPQTPKSAQSSCKATHAHKHTQRSRTHATHTPAKLHMTKPAHPCTPHPAGHCGHRTQCLSLHLPALRWAATHTHCGCWLGNCTVAIQLPRPWNCPANTAYNKRHEQGRCSLPAGV